VSNKKCIEYDMGSVNDGKMIMLNEKESNSPSSVYTQTYSHFHPV
jgi:hypothetical protein